MSLSRCFSNYFTKRRLRVLGVVAVIALFAGLLYWLFDPLQSPWMPRCIFKTLSGWDCPGCGSQRFIHAILHADFAAAWRANAMLCLLSPYMLFWGWIEADPSTAPGLHRRMNSLPATITLLSLLILWAILRNLPITL